MPLETSTAQTNVYLSNYAKNWGLPSDYFAGINLLPILKSPKQTGFTVEFSKKVLKKLNTMRKSRTPIRQLLRELTKNTFTIEYYEWDDDIDDIEKNQNIQNGWLETEIYEEMVDTNMMILNIDREVRIFNKLFDTDGSESVPNSALTYRWTDKTNSNPKEDVKNAMLNVWKTTGFSPNQAVLDLEAWTALVNHPCYEAYSMRGQTKEFWDQFGLTWLVHKVLYLDGWDDSDLTKVIGGKFLTFYKPPFATVKKWQPAYLVRTMYEGEVTKKIYSEEREATIIRTRRAEDLHMIWPALGYFYTNVYA